MKIHMPPTQKNQCFYPNLIVVQKYMFFHYNITFLTHLRFHDANQKKYLGDECSLFLAAINVRNLSYFLAQYVLDY